MISRTQQPDFRGIDDQVRKKCEQVHIHHGAGEAHWPVEAARQSNGGTKPLKIREKLSILAFCWLTVVPYSAVADGAEVVAVAGESKEFSAGWTPPINAFEYYSRDFRMIPAIDFELTASDTGQGSWPEPEDLEMSQQEFDMSHLPAPRLPGNGQADGFFKSLRSLLERPVGQTQSGVVYVGLTAEGRAGIYLRKRESTLHADAFLQPATVPVDSELE